MRHVVITGANRGLGLALCRYYRGHGDRVAALCRRSSPELDELAVAVHTGIDLARDSSAEKAAEALAGTTIDVLVHNAGVLIADGFPELDAEALRRQYEVNALAPLRLTAALADYLAPAAKIAFISSRMGSMADNDSGGYYGYRMSKAALNAGAVSLARDLRGRGVAVVILHPGHVRTEMSWRGTVEPEVAARRVAERIDSLDLAGSGTFWNATGEVLSW